MRKLIAIAILLLCSSLSFAAYEWHKHDNQYSLWQDGKQIGLFDVKTGQYFPLLAPGQLGSPCQAPVLPPAFIGGVNHGIRLDKLRYSRYAINGHECTKREAMRAMDANIPDDTTLMRFTIIGPEANRKQVLTDLATSPELQPWKGKLVIQDYSPEEWPVKNAGFVTTGTPTIYVQAPSGKVLHRQDKYDGAGKLAQALRKLDPNYKPEKDPDVTKPLQDQLIDKAKQVPIPAWVLLGVGSLFLLKKKAPTTNV